MALRALFEAEFSVKWLIDGKSHYGDGVYKEAERILGQGYQYLSDQKNLSELFEIKNRFLNLDYTHHKVVASLKAIEVIPDRKLKQGGKEVSGGASARGSKIWTGKVHAHWREHWINYHFQISWWQCVVRRSSSLFS